MSLIGGTVKKVDAIRNRVMIQPFGGGKEVAVLFDDRSHIYRNGAATTVLGIHRGDRVYVDTMTLEHKVFARTIRVETATGPVEAHGQVVRFNPSNHEVQMRESLTSQTVSFSISDRTALHKKNGVATTADFVPGTLIEAVFAPGARVGSRTMSHSGGARKQLCLCRTDYKCGRGVEGCWPSRMKATRGITNSATMRHRFPTTIVLGLEPR